MFTASLRTAFRSLRRNTLRTGLTTLSIGIGIAAVIAVVAIGAGSTERITRQIDNLGEDFVWIEPGSRNIAGVRTGAGGRRSLSVEDAAALERLVPELAACSPLTEGREQVIAGNQNWNTRYQGVAPSFFAIRRWQLEAGGFFADIDVAEAAKVVVLGGVVAERLFGQENPVGRTIRMGRFPYVVVGVLRPKGVSRAFLDRDDAAFVPYTTALRSLSGRTWIDDIMCAVRSPDLVDRAEFQITQLLRIRHEIAAGEDDDFTIRKPQETLELRAQTMRTMALMLVAVAAVSLVVGGVGIMNIMLVSVSERTQEIGLRLAVGARMRDIRLQFLAEAAALGLCGGAAGVLGGWVAAELLAEYWGWPVVVSEQTATLAVAAAVLAGLIFGYYPAHQASALDPIEAMRAET